MTINFASVFSFMAFLLIALTFGCKTQTVTAPTVEIEERMLDTLFVTAEKPAKLKETQEFKLPKYNPSYTLKNNLLHTKLDLRFDWEKEHVLGKATLTLQPYFYPVMDVELDAKGFDIHNITYAGQLKSLSYEYDGQVLRINLGRTIPKGQEYKIYIDYTAKPAEVLPGGGSAAITSDQGLFFINPKGTELNKPSQIWTQGQTEWNSRWFPTIDKPNERCTQETYLTVDEKYKTLSNGSLVSSTPNSDGTRTDYYKLDLPHAPYLFMVAVGEFAVIKESWNGIPVEYYVEPAYEASAKGIFSNTKEMLQFFSDKLGIQFPWPKYSQVIVRDYVSGAMENTTGVIFGDFVQKTNRELIDNHNEIIIAHELFHHWFGDYVTCESWANLTMNEGFANYSEYLWFEHKYGTDEADQHRLNELNGYLGSVNQGGAHPLIHFGYNDKEDMFDAHSYNKGGLVLHMLRSYLGDEAFFAGLNKYLKDNAYTAVETHDLRLAMEEVSGEDLNWFFNQWYFESGHPELIIDYDYNPERGVVDVTIEQTQNADRSPAIFQLPIAIDIYQTNEPRREYVMLKKRKQTFSFEVIQAPKLVNVDADRVLLCEKRDNKSEEEFIFQFYNASKLLDRYEAIEALYSGGSTAVKQVLADALNDSHWGVRQLAINYIDPVNCSKATKSQIEKMATTDVHSQVRATAIGFLAALGDVQYMPILKKAVENQQEAYSVVSSALLGIYDLDKNTALSYAKKMESDNNSGIIQAVGSIYGEVPDPSRMTFFENRWNQLDIYSSFSFFDSYSKVLRGIDLADANSGLTKLNSVAQNEQMSQWKRFAATKAMFDVKKDYLERASLTSDSSEAEILQSKATEIGEMIKEISNKETNQQLKMIYTNFQ